jgi:hypothetical protein
MSERTSRPLRAQLLHSAHCKRTYPMRPMRFDVPFPARGPSVVLERVVTHSNFLAGTAITLAALLRPDRPAMRDLAAFHRVA